MLIEPDKKMMVQLAKCGVTELVLIMNLLIGVRSQAQLESLIQGLRA
jgi:hypothetical protein